jgi:hypothetical protein
MKKKDLLEKVSLLTKQKKKKKLENKKQKI